MKRFSEGLTAVALIAFVGWEVYLLAWSFLHPEVWDSQPQNDPRICLPLFGVVVVVTVGVWQWLMTRLEAFKRRKRDYERRFKEAITTAKELRDQGREEEGDAAYQEALRLYFEKREFMDSFRF